MNEDFVNYGTQYGANNAMDEAAAGAFFAVAGVMFLVIFLIAIACYVYTAICLMKIAKKTSTENAWLAWIPIANLVLMLQIARRPIWWIVLAIIPFVNLVWIVLGVIVWMDICERLGKDRWLGILSIVPIANLVLPGYLAFSSSTTASLPDNTPTPPAATV